MVEAVSSIGGFVDRLVDCSNNWWMGSYVLGLTDWLMDCNSNLWIGGLIGELDDRLLIGAYIVGLVDRLVHSSGLYDQLVD